MFLNSHHILCPVHTKFACIESLFLMHVYVVVPHVGSVCTLEATVCTGVFVVVRFVEGIIMRRIVVNRLSYKNAFFAGIVAGLFVVDLDVLLDMGVLVGLVLAPGADTLVHVASFNTTLTVDVGYFLLNLDITSTRMFSQLLVVFRLKGAGDAFEEGRIALPVHRLHVPD